VGHPYKAQKVPATLSIYGNGKIPASALGKLSAGGTAWASSVYAGGPAFAFNLMYDDALKDGVKLKAVSGGYRSLEAQEALFFSRYDLVDYGRVPQITRTYRGRTYFLKPNMSPSASPGTSPHGWACAQDFDVSNGAYDWLCKNGPKYGAYLQGPPSYLGRPNPEYEAWHWQIADPENPTRKVRRAWRKFLKALGGQ